MKLAYSLTISAAVFTIPAMAFAPKASNAFSPSPCRSRTHVSALEAQPSSRAEFLSTVAGLSSVLLLFPSQPAAAAKYGSFGAGSPEVLNPADAEMDRDVLQSPKVQSALNKLRTTYKEAVASMQATLASNPQANLRPIIMKELDLAGLRDSLNTVNAALEEDTQRGTDRLIRVILQDIGELELSNAQKEGIERSPRRVAAMTAKLQKLAQAFDDYLAFFV